LSHINVAGTKAKHPLKNQAQDARFQVQPIGATPRVPMGRSPVVVVVDDDPAVCGSLKFSLELEGFVVRAYGNAAEFLNADESQACDCLVVDQRMPGMSGMELIAKLRALEVRTPAILLISQPNPAVAARAAKAAVPIVEKPLFGNALLDRIREACGRN
jgi:two-component system, LuxR family, response regulator FixJ